ncbi:MAG: lysylphosphatidylglycerol synthase domain-containing protein, partial [Methylococcaceae bacterium]
MFQILCVWMNVNIALILGIDLAFADWCWIIGLVSIALLLPITIAGFGVREGVFVSLLAHQGITAEKSIALSLCVFGVSFISALIGFILECMHIINKERDSASRENQKNHNIFTFINNLHVFFMIKITHNRLPVVSMFLKFLGVSLVYISFAAFVYLAHGAEPELSIDHVAYFKMANSILGSHPDGSYWKDINSTKSYAVLMAYVYGITGSHILSLKWILAGLTVLHLYAFQLIMSLFTPDCWKQILFSLLGAFYVSFGATFWGVTDFSASLNRTAVLPLILFAIWFFIKKWDSPVKNIIFPLLMVGSIIHLSVYYIIGVLALMEMSSLVIEQRFRLNTRMFSFILMLAVTVFLQTLISQSSLGTGSYISQAATQGVTRIFQNQATTDNATQGVNRIVQNQATTDNATQGVNRIVQNQATTDNATQGVNRIVQNQATTDNATQGVNRIV